MKWRKLLLLSVAKVSAAIQGIPSSACGLAHQNRTIAIASDFHDDGAKSPEIPQKRGVSASGIAIRNRRSLATFHRTSKSQCKVLEVASDFWGPRLGRPPKGTYSPRGRSRAPSGNPLLRTLSENPSQNPFLLRTLLQNLSRTLLRTFYCDDDDDDDDHDDDKPVMGPSKVPLVTLAPSLH